MAIKTDFRLDKMAKIPIYLQIYQRYKQQIVSGVLKSGDRVNSIRNLASDLNLARGTVELAYQMLISEGYFTTKGPAGTFISSGLENLNDLKTPKIVEHARSIEQSSTSKGILPFQIGLPALDVFPKKIWARLANHRLRNIDVEALNYPDPAGYLPLRNAIANYLGISRGINCSPEQIFITAGYRGALDLISHTLLHTNDQGWYEEPGYIRARNFMLNRGMLLEPIPVDENGLNVDIGIERAPNAQFAIVTPTHQSPTGVALSLARRLQLLEWASNHEAWIIEDDYDSEFRYLGRPLPALKSLDQNDCVLYCGTFSKVLFPGLHLGYLVVPYQQIESFKNSVNQVSGVGTVTLQATITDFMEQGHFARHLSRMRALYATRRKFLINAFYKTFGSNIEISQQAGGTHILVLFNHHNYNDKTFPCMAQIHNLGIQALSDWCLVDTKSKGLLASFTNIRGQQHAYELVDLLRQALKERL